MKFILSCIVLALVLSCGHKEKKPSHQLGVAHLEVSGNPEAQKHFEQGLLLLHSFEYVDAREAFEKAEKADPDMAMAYWGQAMTRNHSIWFEQDYQEATAVLKRMKGRTALKMDTPLEEDLIKAVSILYQPEKPKQTRDREYCDFMASLHEKHPDNQETAAFYALSLLATVSEGRNYEVYGEAAQIAKKVLKANPEHPGALHYLIHSYDDPDHAQLALEAADAYAVVAPDAAHALHMPSHIYVAMGMWDKVVSSNEDSYEASIKRMERKALSNDARGYHSYHWLQYGYLQQGRASEAEAMTLALENYIKASPSKRGRSHMVFLKGTYLSETGNWDSRVADIPVQTEDLNIVIRGQEAFTRAMLAFHQKDEAGLTALIADLESELEREAVKVDNQEKGFTACSNLTRESATRTDLSLAGVMVLQMKGLQTWLNEDTEATEDFFKAAVTQEEGLTYSYGPPVIQKPTHELYADWLLAEGRTHEALQQYELTLKKAPKRSRALEGILKSSELLDNKEMAMAVKTILKQQKVSAEGSSL